MFHKLMWFSSGDMINSTENSSQYWDGGTLFQTILTKHEIALAN